MQTILVDGNLIAPSKITCIGRNYVAHIEELGNEIPEEMVVFNKPNSALGNTLHSFIDEPLSYESELSFVVRDGKFCAVGFGLDITKRELQSRLKKKGLPWERAKGFDGAVIFSEFVALPKNSHELSLKLTVDGALRQAGGVDSMMYKPDTILQELKKFMHLEDGDVVMTGTPAGVGVIQAGESFDCQILLNGEMLLSTNWVAQ